MVEAVHFLQQENARLREENRGLSDRLLQLQNTVRALNQLHHSLATLGPDTDVYGLVRTILESALRAVGSEDGSLLLLDEEKQELVFVEVAGTQKESLTGYRMPLSTGIAGAVIANRQAALVPDVRVEPRWSPHVDESIGFQTFSLMCAPVMDETRVLGALEVVNKRGGAPFTEEDLDILLLVAQLAAWVIVRAERVLATE